jgi:outer membrane biosynthesis protein TonB
MLGTAQRLSTRIVSTRRLLVGAALPALLATLLIAAPAQADPGTEGSGETLGGGAPVSETSEVPASPEGTAAPGAGEAPATEPQPQPQPEAPPAETPAPVAAETITEPPPAPPAPEPVAEPPPPPAPEPVLETPVPPESPTPPSAPERPVESTSPELPARPKTDEKSTTGVIVPATATPSGPSGPEAPPSGAVAGTPTGTMIINLAEAEVPSEASPETHRAAAARGAAGGGEVRSCELQGLGGPTAAGCASSGWVRSPGALRPISVITLAPVTAALEGAEATSVAAGQDPSGSVGGGRPMPSSPGPAPGGASGGASGGGSGVGLSGFIAFAVLLLLAAPRAMRRLRLACQPWLTAFFVLIPERPG